ncbi:S-adenosyl-L-methionine-dependent methyltransferase, partial [Byssothecium circinans]
LVKIGDVVELKDESEIGLRTRQYGDFFLVKTIVENVQSEDLNLRGFRLRRCTRLSPLFDGKLNDLVLLMEVDRYDKRSHHVQGIVEVAVDAVVGKRVCHFTNLTYEQMGLRTTPTFVPALLARLKDAKAISDYVFRNGPLYCRWVHISIKEWNGKPYGGEVRRLYKRERDEFAKLSDITQTSRAAASNGDESDESDDFTIIENPQKRRSSSVESLDHDPRKRRPGIATKPMQLTFGDFFCCAGGASYGAVDAGLLVSYGVEIDGEVMESYRRNHPGATALEMDAHDFPSFASRSNFYVDHAHFSTTCKYFAICHTRPGKDDQMNFETIYVVGPILELLKPPYATAEQAPGMILLRKHKPAFRLFLNMILRAGFNVRYQVADLASHDLPQRRRRLLFNMSKIGFPLAPFPNPTCGPKGSGLKRYVTVADALEKLERIPPGLRDDPLHRPETLRRCNKEPYDPRNSLLKGCLTTSGGENYHYSGKRRNTARENSQFQTFPLSAHFNGSPTLVIHILTPAIVGNAYPPSPASQHFLSNAQTREAFEHGFISDEEEIHDL